MKNRRSRHAPSGPKRCRPWIQRHIILLLFLVSTTVTSTAVADSDTFVVPLPALGDEGWQPLTFRSIEKATRYDPGIDPSGRPAYRASSHCSASAMLLALPENFDPLKTPRLAWRWRIERGLDNEDERSEAGDDFAARVYVLFRFDPGRASLWRRLQNQMGRRIFNAEIPGEALSYVWASRQDPGAHWTSPNQKDARLLVLESASDQLGSQAWREAVVDLIGDAQRVFETPERRRPYAIGLMTDADNTCQKAVAWFSDFRLLGPRDAEHAEKNRRF